jgi:glucose-1-phosphate thymidylyltransferase
MKIVIPMAGMGKRMRPHTLTIPKPLISIAGKPIVQRLVEDIVKACDEKVDEIGFVIGNFGIEVENQLIEIAEKLGAEGKIYFQDKPLGTAHAILCAKPTLRGKVVVAFADTLFRANFIIDENRDGTIWVHSVDDPSAFGVVTTNQEGVINGFIEKPKEPVSNQAIIGIYYFKEGEYLCEQLEYLIDNNIEKNGEFQLTDALQNMMKLGTRFTTGNVDEWLDCGNKNATVFANQRILQINHIEPLISPGVKTTETIIVKPCFIGRNVEIGHSIIGPNVSIGDNTKIDYSIITNSIVQNNTRITNANLDNSMIGNYVDFKGNIAEVSMGDYTTLSE